MSAVSFCCCPFPAAGKIPGRRKPIPGSGIVTFTAMTGQGETRSSQEGSFETGDAIGVFAIEPKTGVYWAVNNKYTYDGQKFKPEAEADNIIVTVGTDFDFYVYYPFKTGQTDITGDLPYRRQPERKGGLDFRGLHDSDLYRSYPGLHGPTEFQTQDVDRRGQDR